MNALTLTLIRLAFLAVLWLFVIAAVGVVRTDLFGHALVQPAAAPPGSKAQRRAGRRGPHGRARPARAAPQRLLVTGGSLTGTTIALTDSRSPSAGRMTPRWCSPMTTLRADTPGCFPQNGQWIVEDLGSTNGTYLDRQKVTQPTPVPAGVPIRIGKTVLELRR